jgi:hypothetical protein
VEEDTSLWRGLGDLVLPGESEKRNPRKKARFARRVVQRITIGIVRLG